MAKCPLFCHSYQPHWQYGYFQFAFVVSQVIENSDLDLSKQCATACFNETILNLHQNAVSMYSMKPNWIGATDQCDPGNFSLLF